MGIKMNWWTRKPLIQTPPQKRYEVVKELKAFTEYRVEVHRTDGGQHAISFTTNLVPQMIEIWYGVYDRFYEKADKELQKFLDNLNSKIFVLVGSEMIRVTDIKYCRVEPYVIEHEVEVVRGVKD